MTPSEDAGSFDGSCLVDNAQALAFARHAGARRKVDGRAFINHPLAVAQILKHAFPADATAIAAALLHDVLEETNTSLAEIRAATSGEVAAYVHLLTEDRSIPTKRERKRDVRNRVATASAGVQAVLVADCLANARDLRDAIARDGLATVTSRLSQPATDKVEHYHLTVGVLGGTPRLQPLLAELRAAIGQLASLVQPVRDHAENPH